MVDDMSFNRLYLLLIISKKKRLVMQTSIEWLWEQIPFEFTSKRSAFELFEQAKEMEFEQHLKWNKFLETEKTLGISDVKTIERIQWYYNQYYNEKFKQDL